MLPVNKRDPSAVECPATFLLLFWGQEAQAVGSGDCEGCWHCSLLVCFLIHCC